VSHVTAKNFRGRKQKNGSKISFGPVPFNRGKLEQKIKIPLANVTKTHPESDCAAAPSSRVCLGLGFRV
jgi:hypothetical protein